MTPSHHDVKKPSLNEIGGTTALARSKKFLGHVINSSWGTPRTVVVGVME
jgi:hypothetical protein